MAGTLTMIFKWFFEALGLSLVDFKVDEILGKGKRTTDDGETTDDDGASILESGNAKATRDEAFLMQALAAAMNPEEVKRLTYPEEWTITGYEREAVEEIISEATAQEKERICHLIGNTAEVIKGVDAKGRKDIFIQNDLGTIMILGMVHKARKGHGPDLMCITPMHKEEFLNSIRISLKAAGAYNTPGNKMKEGLSRFCGNLSTVIETIPPGTEAKIDDWTRKLKVIRDRI